MTKNIQNIAPLLAPHFIDIDNDEIILEENNKLVNHNSHRLGLYHKYLGLLHDSWFIKTIATDEKLSFTLNDFTTHVFSDVIVDKKMLAIDHEQLVFPIQLDFDIKALSYNTVDEDGNIHRIEPTSIDEYLYEQIISIDEDSISLGIIVWKNGVRNRHGQHILILMNVNRIELTELQDNAWTRIFSTTYDIYYNYFKKQLGLGRYLSDQPSCYELYDEFEKQIKHKV